MRQPVAYIRKSRVFDEKATVSWEVQEQKTRELAATYGDNGGRLLILSDWNISGRKGTGARPGYKRLVEMILADECSALYSYNLARLSRSVQDLRSLMAMADKHEVPVRLVADHVDTSTATGRMLLTVLSAVDEMTADLASEHARDAVAARRARGDHIGPRNYGEVEGEDLNAMLASYDEAGSFMGAAKLLNLRGVPTRRGGPWSTTSVRSVLVREGAAERATRPGAKSRGPFLLYGLLRCACGHTLTGLRYQNGSNLNYVSYRCTRHWQVPNHGLASVPEKRLLGWVQDEVARFRVPETVVMEQERQAERDRIERRKADLSFMLENGGITRDEYLRRLAVIKTDEAALAAKEAAAAIVPIPQKIDWDWAPEDLNKLLAALWEYVALDEKMQPVAAKWKYPEWRDAALDREVRLEDLPAGQRDALMAKVDASRHAAAREGSNAPHNPGN